MIISNYRQYFSIPSYIFPDGRILRPVIPIALKYGNQIIDYEALIDSGADHCIFHAEVGELLDIPIKKGHRIFFHGTSDSSQVAYFHKVKICIKNCEADTVVAFSYDIASIPYGLLGQKGFFDIFEVRMNLQKEQVKLLPLK